MNDQKNDKKNLPAIGEREEVKLKKQNLKYISRRSGVALEDLRKMLEMSKRRGINRTVTFVVKAD